MGHLLGVIDQARLDEQRGVVQNEKRQGENQPYGRVFEALVQRASFPAGHPYRWLPIGSMEDLERRDRSTTSRSGSAPTTARRTRCSCSPATSTSPTAREKAQKYFGAHPAGPRAHAAARPGSRRAPRATREVMYDQVAQTRLHRVVEHAGVRHRRTPTCSTSPAQILGGGKTSRLYERLVYRDQIADYASAGHERARDRRAVLHLGRREARRRRTARSRRRSSEELAPLHGEGPDAGRARARPDGGARRLRARPRAHRRLRRQGRRARDVRGVRRPIRAAIDDRSRARGRRHPSSCGGSPSAGSHRATTRSRCSRYAAYRTRRDRAPSTARPGLPVIDDVSRTSPSRRSQRAKLANGMPVILAQRHRTCRWCGSRCSFDAGYAADREPQARHLELHDRRCSTRARRQLDALAIAARAEDARRGCSPPARRSTPRRVASRR